MSDIPPLLLILDELLVPAAGLAQAARELGLELRQRRLADLPADEAARVKALIVVTSPVTAELLARLPALEAIAVSFTGYDHIDLAACRARGIRVSNVPSYATDSVAELALGLALAVLRDIPAGDAAVRHGGWSGRFIGAELRGRTVGIVGTGRAGLAAARLFKACGCRILGASRSPKPELAERGEPRVLDALLAESDIVSLHCPLNEATRGLISAERLALMKPGAILINTARGAVVDEAALLEALAAGRLAGAGIDVFEQEPTPRDLRPVTRAVFTPHLAYRSREALDRKAALTLRYLGELLRGEACEAELV